MTAYETLEKHFEEINNLEHAAAILSWDEAAMMPPASGDARAAALATLAGVMHQKLIKADIGDLVADARESTDSMDRWQRANLKEMSRRWQQAVAIPADLVVASSRANSRCEQAWRIYRAENDWQNIRPLLAEVVTLARQTATCLGEAQSLSPYDALMDKWEPGLRATSVDNIFDDLKDFLPPFIDEVICRQQAIRKLPLAGPFSIEQQKQLATSLMTSVGFDTSRGRMDVSHHPFCGGVRDDTRITTRYSENEFLTALMAVLHETGHALYQQGLPGQWSHQPVGDALGMAIHESQSLLMEMQVCRSRDFLRYATPIIRNELGPSTEDPAWTEQNLHRHYTHVEKGFIRVNADELTYSLHVILRYEIEQALFGGAINVAELPDVWEQHMHSYLGLSTKGNFRDGCMQDVHWFAGIFGYFPSYTLGALIAAQLYGTARAHNEGIPASVSEGNFTPLLTWLRENIHSQGRLMNADELIRNISGVPLDTHFFKEHLQARYLSD